MRDANVALLRSLAILVPVTMLFVGAVASFAKRERPPALLQLLGAGGLVVVVLTHVSEALHLLPWMAWGQGHGAGHYLDLGSTVVGLALFPLGYLLDALGMRRASPLRDGVPRPLAGR